MANQVSRLSQSALNFFSTTSPITLAKSSTPFSAGAKKAVLAAITDALRLKTSQSFQYLWSHLVNLDISNQLDPSAEKASLLIKADKACKTVLKTLKGQNSPLNLIYTSKLSKKPIGVNRDGTMNCSLIASYQLLLNAGLLDLLPDGVLDEWKYFKGDVYSLRTSLCALAPNLISHSHYTQEDASEIILKLIEKELFDSEEQKKKTQGAHPTAWKATITRTYDTSTLPRNIRAAEKTSHITITETLKTIELGDKISIHGLRFPTLIKNHFQDNKKVALEHANHVTHRNENYLKQRISEHTKADTLPPHLFLSFRRFAFTAYGAVKIQAPIRGIPLEWEIPQEFSSRRSRTPTVYELKGFTIHEGGVNYGHYYSVIKRNNAWWKCNDDSVTSLTERQVRHELTKSYILQYSKKSK